MNVALVMFKADGVRRDFPVDKSRFVVGRKSSCDLRVPLNSVSRRHCEILVEDQTVRLRDLGSSNGTYHNSSRVQETELAAGDEIVIGPVVFTVVLDGQPEQIKPVRTIIGSSNGSSETAVSVAAGSGEQSSVKSGTPIEDDGDDEPGEVEPEQHTPTVDLDDPIAALEALADAEKNNDKYDEQDILNDLQLIDDDDDDR